MERYYAINYSKSMEHIHKAVVVPMEFKVRNSVSFYLGEDPFVTRIILPDDAPACSPIGLMHAFVISNGNKSRNYVGMLLTGKTLKNYADALTNVGAYWPPHMLDDYKASAIETLSAAGLTLGGEGTPAAYYVQRESIPNQTYMNVHWLNLGKLDQNNAMSLAKLKPQAPAYPKAVVPYAVFRKWLDEGNVRINTKRNMRKTKKGYSPSPQLRNLMDAKLFTSFELFGVQL